jgi:thiamine biosynthesis lipoprotein
MTSSSPSTETLARARALLGTVVTIRAGGPKFSAAQMAIEIGFAEIARIHGLMSFQSGMSDVARLNRMAHRRAVAVNRRTYAVLSDALRFAAESGGLFDPTVAPQLVESGLLRHPLGAPEPDEKASFRDILLGPHNQVRFARPLWIDLSGIAKGYAVDRALNRLVALGAGQIAINAGGDLRVHGPETARVALAAPPRADGQIPVIEIADGALASSAQGPAPASPHIDGVTRKAVPPGRFVSVAAPHCLDADALTKIALADPAAAKPLLARYHAQAFLFEADGAAHALGLAA